MRAGRRSPGHLHVDRRFALEQLVLLEQLLADVDETRGRIRAVEGDSDPVEALLETLVMEPGGEESSIDCTQDFVYAISKYKAAVLDRHACFGARQEAAVYVYNVSRLHSFDGFVPGKDAVNRGAGLGGSTGFGSGRGVGAEGGGEHRKRTSPGVGESPAKSSSGREGARQLHRRPRSRG
jgi:hypothetical protein